jgi:hypothetical protein
VLAKSLKPTHDRATHTHTEDVCINYNKRWNKLWDGHNLVRVGSLMCHNPIATRLSLTRQYYPPHHLAFQLTNSARLLGCHAIQLWLYKPTTTNDRRTTFKTLTMELRQLAFLLTARRQRRRPVGSFFLKLEFDLLSYRRLYSISVVSNFIPISLRLERWRFHPGEKAKTFWLVHNYKF